MRINPPSSAALLSLALLVTSCRLENPVNPVSRTIETDEARVASRYDERVEKLLLQEGDALAGGQIIVEPESSDLQAFLESPAA